MPRRTLSDADSDLYREVGRKIREARGARKQSQIANAVGLTRTSITNIESGRQKMLLDTFVRIADELGVPPAELLPNPNLAGNDGAPFAAPKGMDAQTRQFVEATVAKALANKNRSRR